MYDFAKFREAVLTGDAAAAVSLTRQALDGGVEPVDLISQGISPAMNEVGRLFEEGEYFVPELLISARATKAVFEILRPLLAKKGVQSAGRIVLGTVQGDLHDIGKNLVAAMLEGGGFEVTDLGINVAPERFIAAARDTQAQIIGLSALLTTTMPAMKTAIDAFREAGIRGRVKVMIGGAPITRSYAESIGADGYGENAAVSVDLARQLIGA
ncbi:MAG: corrinoid protein [Vicinamibacteria bacterium]|nr:corrinoid protein [Vicinamibacteria bacterium]